MTTRSKTIISLVLFAVIFAALLVTATFTDLQVSQILTAHSLEPGNYYTNDTFGAVLEIMGSAPVYLMLAFAAQIFFWYIMRNWQKKGVKELVALLLIVGGTYAYYELFGDMVKYILQHVDAYEFKGAPFLVGTQIFFAGLTMFFATMSVRNYSDESLKKLVMFAVAILCIAALSNLIVNLLKTPVGRMRFRAMNTDGGASIGGFDNFTRWYVFNGQMAKEEMMALFGTTDACKSFPSGHTCAAGTAYALTMLIDVFDIKSKAKKAALWILPILYTAAVAISRIVVGAHFFSDVLVGGTLTFASMIIFREIFICKGSHVKALFGKAE
ncbi:MAG: phosphatase PAP2 family protein [Clostridia bacterium]|nr:phosphatase PAP2 family protein [Clostridia bacterium]